MLLSATSIPLWFVFFSHLAESHRSRAQRDAYSHPGVEETPLASMLLATPAGVRTPRSASRAGRTRASSPSAELGAAAAELTKVPLKMPDGLASEAPHGGDPEAGARKVKALCDTAKALSDLGLHDKAKPVYQLCHDVMDHGHKSLRAYRHKLKLKLRREGDNDVRLMKDVLELREKVLGKDHPGTFKSRYNYANVLCDVGRHTEAERLKKELLKLKQNELGPDHADTVKTMRSYAKTLMALGRVDEGEALQKEAYKISRRTVGPEHPDTIKALMDYIETRANESSETSAKHPVVDGLEQLGGSFSGRMVLQSISPFGNPPPGISHTLNEPGHSAEHSRQHINIVQSVPLSAHALQYR